jgi:uncharacterized DUF497 family protein
LKIVGIIWVSEIENKIYKKHKITKEEVEEVLSSKPYFRFVENGFREGEDLYVAFGRTKSGRYLAVFFIYKISQEALIVTSREMTEKERRRYIK